MGLAQGTNKEIRFKRQASKGTVAGTSAGQKLRRVTGGFELQKETYNTADEITSTRQMLSSRHGVKLVNGSLNGLLSPGTYSDMVSALLRRDYAAVSAITSLSITIAGSGPYTVTRASGDFLAGGIKVGMVVRLTAGTFNAANLNKNLLVTGVTATVITCVPLNGVALVAEGPIASATVAVPGKVTYVPSTGHTNVYYGIEEWYPDADATGVSELSNDVKVGSASFSLPGSGNATIDLSFMGLSQTRATSVYFTSPTAETTTDVLVAASGALYVGGVAQAIITDLNMEVSANQTAADGVVGSTTRPDIFDGKVTVTGSFTAYFDSVTIANAFVNETETSILSALTAGTTAAADFKTIYLPRIKVNTDTVDDGEVGLKRTYNFEAIYNAAGGAALATQQTTIQVQDSAAP
jgi:hypothetical protein